MTFTYDPTDQIGRVRMNIPDKVEADAFWTDEEIQAFLDQEDSNVKRATAAALEAMASDEAYVQKQAVSRALLERAKLLREQADLADAGEEGGAFDVAEMVHDDFSARERIAKEAQRDG